MFFDANVVIALHTQTERCNRGWLTVYIMDVVSPGRTMSDHAPSIVA